MRRLFVLLACVARIGTGLFAASGPAAAGTTPTLTAHNLRPQISAYGHPRFTFVAKHVRSGSRVVLQRGTAKGWRTIDRTAKRSGTVRGSFTAVSPHRLGHYYYRLAIARKGTLSAPTTRRSVYAFGKVSMRALCRGVLGNDCVDGMQALGDGSNFRYVMTTGINETDDPWTAQFGAARTSCRSLTMTYVSDSPDATSTYLELRQPKQKVQRHTSSSRKVGTFTASLTGGRFGVSVEQDAAAVFMFFNGHGSCWSATGAR